MTRSQRAARLWALFGGRKGRRRELDPTRSDLVVVAESFDDAEACSAVLERATSFDAGADAVLRHHLVMPAESVAIVVSIAAQDGYEPEDAGEFLILRRVQRLDALHCAQERSRMVGLAQRHDGDYRGWDALQPSGVDVQGS